MHTTGCFVASAGKDCSPKQTAEWIPQLNSGLRLKRLPLFTIKSNLCFCKILQFLGIFIQPSCILGQKLQNSILEHEGHTKEILSKFNSKIPPLLSLKYNSKLCGKF